MRSFPLERPSSRATEEDGSIFSRELGVLEQDTLAETTIFDLLVVLSRLITPCSEPTPALAKLKLKTTSGNHHLMRPNQF